MTDEQVWDDLSRFALAMKRGATVVFKSGERRPYELSEGHGVDHHSIRQRNGIAEIIEPPQKKVRALNSEEWLGVQGCIVVSPMEYEGSAVKAFGTHNGQAECLFAARATCHPPGFPKDVRNLWVEYHT